MPLIACPHCSKQYNTPDCTIGLNMSTVVLTCSKCGKKFGIPQTDLGGPATCPLCGMGVITAAPVAGMAPPPLPRKSVSPARLLICAGVGLIAIGVGLVLFYWVIYDTTTTLEHPFQSRTIPVGSLHDFIQQEALRPPPSRVYNIARMHNRLVGVIVGIACLTLGTVLVIVGKRRR